MTSPIIHLRVHHKPIKRDRQLQKKNHSRNPAQKRHARILVEPVASENQVFSSEPRDNRARQLGWLPLPRSNRTSIDDSPFSVDDSSRTKRPEEDQCPQTHHLKKSNWRN